MGYGCGPTFQLVQEIRHDHLFNNVFGQTKALWTALSEDPVVHPATLDAIMYLEFASLFKAGSERLGSFVTTKIDKLWMSDIGLNMNDMYINVGSTVHRRTKRHTKILCQIFSQDYRQTPLKVDGMELTMVASSKTEEMPPPSSEHNLNYMCSEVDVELMDVEQLKNYPTARIPPNSEWGAKRKLIRDFLLLYLQSLDGRLKDMGTTPASKHGLAFVEQAQFLWQRSDVVLPASLFYLRVEVLKHADRS